MAMLLRVERPMVAVLENVLDDCECDELIRRALVRRGLAAKLMPLDDTPPQLAATGAGPRPRCADHRRVRVWLGKTPENGSGRGGDRREPHLTADLSGRG